MIIRITIVIKKVILIIIIIIIIIMKIMIRMIKIKTDDDLVLRLNLIYELSKTICYLQNVELYYKYRFGKSLLMR